MLFNSLDFALFLHIVFALYWFVCRKHLQRQNLLLLIASYVFYAWWDWRFLGLIVLSTLVDYAVGRMLAVTEQRDIKRYWLWVSIATNLGLLGFFKYYNFFIESWISAWQSLGVTMEVSTLRIILPVGISFYTFQTLSYTIDIYRHKLKPTNNLIQFAAFVSFFPQLVAGPIERASQLLPQFKNPRRFDANFAMSGVYLIIWGLFKKVVVADNCAFFVNQIFEAPQSHSSATLFMGAVLFGFQIYGDFSGYSSIAIGVARLFGFSLMTNFNFPYFSRDIAEFWRRWHISLSTWFRDYVYIPLGGSQGNKAMQIRNVLLVFLISGFWHGANWTFIVWGAIHGLLFLPLLLFGAQHRYKGSFKMTFRDCPKIVLTFVLVTFAWLFFRADTIGIAYEMLVRILRWQDSSLVLFYKSSKAALLSLMLVFSIVVLLGVELYTVQNKRQEVSLNLVSALVLALVITFFGVFKNPSDFIYFQF